MNLNFEPLNLPSFLSSISIDTVLLIALACIVDYFKYSTESYQEFVEF